MLWGGRRAIIVVALLAGAGCEDVTRWTLPPPPDDVDLVFAVLYRGEAPVSIGPVITPDVLYGGDYALRADDPELDARLFFFSIAALQSAAATVCGQLPVAIDRAECRAAIDGCAAAPASCLAPVVDGAGCGDRLRLPDDLPVVAMQGPGGILRARPATVATISGVAVCGPTIRADCPNLRPAFVVTDGAGYRCVAPVEQQGCRLTLDLAVCGHGRPTLQVDPSGQLTAIDGRCAIVDQDGSIALDCDGQTLSATPMGEQIAASGCLRTGPTTYETDLGSGSPQIGRITGWARLEPAGWPERWVMTGTGRDRCGLEGCFAGGIDCGRRCSEGCESFEIRYCADPPWPACVGRDRRALCRARCQAFCQRAATDLGGCLEVVRGAVVTTSPPATPEDDGGRHALVDDDRGPLGAQAVVTLGDPATPTVVAVGRRVLHALRPGAVDQLARTSTLAPGLTLAGAVRTDDESLLAFGATAEGAAWSEVQLENGALRERRTGRISALAMADLGAAAGARWFFASSAPTGGAQTSAVLVVIEDGTEVVVPLVGRPTALTALPADGAVVAVETDTGGAVGRIAPSGPAVWTPTLTGLRPTALAVDPARCGEPCTVWVAYEPTIGVGPAVVGRVEVGTEQISMPLAFVPTALERIGLVAVDGPRRSVVAISALRNQLVELPITLP